MVGWDQLFPSKLKSQTAISKWPNSPEKKSLKISLKQTLIDFCRESSIHGIKYLVEPDQHWLEKLFWLSPCSKTKYKLTVGKMLAVFRERESPGQVFQSSREKILLL